LSFLRSSGVRRAHERPPTRRASDLGAVQRDRDVLAVQGEVQQQLVVGTVQERRVERDEGQAAPGGEAGGGVQRELLGDADVEDRSEEHTSELQSRENLVCRLLLEQQ